MKAITLRNLPPEIEKVVRKEAERKRTSINKELGPSSTMTLMLWIATSAMEYGLHVLTTDAHYQKISQIMVDFFPAS